MMVGRRLTLALVFLAAIGLYYWPQASNPLSDAPYPDRTPASTKNYVTQGLCDGLPRLSLKTAPGFCVGLVHNGEGMVFPRSVVWLGNDAFVVDMGGWSQNRGKIFALKKQGDTYAILPVLEANKLSSLQRYLLDRPHGLRAGPDGKLYVGATSAIFRFDPKAPDPYRSIEVLVRDMPNEGKHPLKEFIFDPKGNLIVNVGAPSNACERATRGGICTESEGPRSAAHLRRYRRNSDGTYSARFEVIATGLRNSMALAYDPLTGLLYQGENSRDSIDKVDSRISDAKHPMEELNIIRENQNYGWPYCYENKKNSPEYPQYNCQATASPSLDLPPHAAPLGMLFYRGSMLPPSYKDRLIMSFHGYREGGHRIVTLNRNSQGFVTGPVLSLVYDWGAKANQPLGAPVNMSIAPDGSIWIAEDKNQKILRLSYNSQLGDGTPVNELGSSVETTELESVVMDRKRKLEARLKVASATSFVRIQAKILDAYCVSCHGSQNAPGISLFPFDYQGNYQRLLAKRGASNSPYVIPFKPQESEFYLRLFGEKFPLMPSQGFATKQEAEAVQSLVRQWIEAGAKE